MAIKSMNWLKSLTDRSKKTLYNIGWTLFGAYLAFLLWRLFFYAYGTYFRSASVVIRYNIVPFKTILWFLQNKGGFSQFEIVTNLLGNIAAFTPFGFFMAVLVKRVRSLKGTMTATLLFSLTVEIAQIVTRLGTFDIDDILLNTVGGLVGFGIAVAFLTFITIVTERFS